MIEEISCGVIVIDTTQREPLFLLLKQTEGHWSFPKGHIEKEETAIEAAARELSEEAGITECDIQMEPVFTEDYSFTHDGNEILKTNYYFLGYVTSQDVTIQAAEVTEYRWVTRDEALATFTFSGQKETLKKVLEYLDETSNSSTRLGR